MRVVVRVKYALLLSDIKPQFIRADTFHLKKIAGTKFHDDPFTAYQVMFVRADVTANRHTTGIPTLATAILIFQQ